MSNLQDYFMWKTRVGLQAEIFLEDADRYIATLEKAEVFIKQTTEMGLAMDIWRVKTGIKILKNLVEEMSGKTEEKKER